MIGSAQGGTSSPPRPVSPSLCLRPGSPRLHRTETDPFPPNLRTLTPKTGQFHACIHVSPPLIFVRLACSKSNPAKRAWEVFNLKYAVFWVGCFAAIIGFDLYEDFDEVLLSYFHAKYKRKGFQARVRRDGGQQGLLVHLQVQVRGGRSGAIFVFVKVRTIPPSVFSLPGYIQNIDPNNKIRCCFAVLSVKRSARDLRRPPQTRRNAGYFIPMFLLQMIDLKCVLVPPLPAAGRISWPT